MMIKDIEVRGTIETTAEIEETTLIDTTGTEMTVQSAGITIRATEGKNEMVDDTIHVIAVTTETETEMIEMAIEIAIRGSRDDDRRSGKR